MRTTNKRAAEFLLVVTRSLDQSPGLMAELSRREFKTVSLPAISFRTLPIDAESERILSDLRANRYQWIIFTSQNGVRAFHEICRSELSGDLEFLRQIKIACQGKRTSQEVMTCFSRAADFVPDISLQEGLAKGLLNHDLRGKRVLLAVAQRGRDMLQSLLEKGGAQVERWAVYETVPLELDRQALDRIAAHNRDKVVYLFFSPSAVETCLNQFSELDKQVLKESKIVSIGPITSAALAQSGLSCNFEAEIHSEKGVLQAIEDLLISLTEANMEEALDLCSMKCVPCRGGVPPLSEDEQAKYLRGVRGWEIISGHHLTKLFEFPSFKSSIKWVSCVADLAEEQGHHPDLHISFKKVRVDIWTHKIDGLTVSDFVLAAKIDELPISA